MYLLATGLNRWIVLWVSYLIPSTEDRLGSVRISVGEPSHYLIANRFLYSRHFEGAPTSSPVQKGRAVAPVSGKREADSSSNIGFLVSFVKHWRVSGSKWADSRGLRGCRSDGGSIHTRIDTLLFPSTYETLISFHNRIIENEECFEYWIQSWIQRDPGSPGKFATVTPIAS